MYTLILFDRQLYASSPEPSAYVLQNIGIGKTIPFAACQTAELYYNFHKTWSTLKRNELHSFEPVADLKDIALSTGINTPASHVTLWPHEEYAVLTGRQRSAYRYYETHYVRLLVNSSAMAFPKNNFCSLYMSSSLLFMS